MELDLLGNLGTWVAFAWFLLGLTLGVGHSLSLRHSVARPGPSLALMGMARIAVVAAVLIAASARGGLKPTVLGWILGFLLATVCVRPRAAVGRGQDDGSTSPNPDRNRDARNVA